MANTVLGRGPGLQIEYSAAQTWGGGTKRTIKIDFGAKVYGSSNQSKFQYSARYYIVVNGVEGYWRTLKPVEWWYATQGYRWYSDSLTVDVGTTGSGSVPVKIVFDSGGHGWEHTLPFNCSFSSTNSKPVMSGSVSVSPSGTFSENQSSLSLTSPAGSDSDGNISGYRIQASINGGDYYTIHDGGSRSYTHNISGYGEGTSFRYRADCYDSGGLYSQDWAYSDTVYKNRFNMATLASNSSIDKSTQNIILTYSGGSNTQSGVGINYSISCKETTIHNASVGSGSITIGIKRGGESISGPYIMWSDLVNLFKDSQGKGTLTFVLTGRNTNGTTKTSIKTISANTQNVPSFSGATISTNSAESTAYQQAKDTKNWYFIPDGSKTIRVKWGAATPSGKGETIKYKVFVAYDSGSWQELGTTSSLYYNHAVAKQTTSKQIKYLVRAIPSFNENNYKDSQTPAQTIHFYNPPTLTKGNIIRGGSTADVNITIKTPTSIPSINTVGTWSCSNGQSGALNQSQKEQAIKVTGLSENGTYTLTIVYNDGTGFNPTNKTETISVGAVQPIFYVNKYGVGVGGYKADSNTALVVKGRTQTDSLQLLMPFGGDCDAMRGESSMATSTIATNSPGSYYYVRNSSISNTYGFQIASYYGSTNIFKIRGAYDTGKWKPWEQIYTTGFKPTPAEIGAAPASNSPNYLSTSGGTITKTSGPQLILENNGNDEASLVLKRGPHTSWKVENNKGIFKLGQDYDKRGTFKTMMTLDYQGNVDFNGLGYSYREGNYIKLHNGIKIFTGEWWVSGNSTRRINFPSGLFSEWISAPIVGLSVPSGDWQRYGTHGQIACIGYDKNGFNLANYVSGKECVIAVMIIGK